VARSDRDPGGFAFAGINSPDYLAVLRRSATYFTIGGDLRSDYPGGNIVCPLIPGTGLGGVATAFEFT
jgi:hypothetical protein